MNYSNLKCSSLLFRVVSHWAIYSTSYGQVQAAVVVVSEHVVGFEYWLYYIIINIHSSLSLLIFVYETIPSENHFYFYSITANFSNFLLFLSFYFAVWLCALIVKLYIVSSNVTVMRRIDGDCLACKLCTWFEIIFHEYWYQ